MNNDEVKVKVNKEKDQKAYFLEYEQKRKEEQSRLPTCYISNDLRRDLDLLIERRNLKMKDVMLSGVMLMLALDEKFNDDFMELLVTNTFKRSRSDIEKELNLNITSFLKKKLKKV